MKKLAFALCTALLLIAACKKDDNKPGTSGGTSKICTGNGSSDYFPLAINNSWSYKDDGGGNQFTYTIASSATFGTQVYFKVDNSLGGSLYLRKATNGDIKAYSIATATEYTYIPAAPITNQSWIYPLQGAATRKILSTSASVTTSSCTYTGVLQIQHYDALGNPGAVIYYKKGIGIVRTDEMSPGSIVTDLKTITIQ